MTLIQYEGLAVALLGAIGTIILFFNTYSLEPLQGGIFGSLELDENNKKIKNKNLNRIFFQKIGLGFLCASFIVQAISIFLPG